MNTDIRLELDMLKAVSRFFLNHPITPALPRATAAIADVNSIITSLEAAAQLQVAGLGKSEGAVDLRKSTARELRAFLCDVNRTARTLEPEHPGIRPSFRLPRSGSFPKLLAAAGNIVAVATPLSAAFVDAGMPATFLEHLGELLTAFQNATSSKAAGLLTRALGTATLKETARLGMIAVRKLDACARNHFRAQPEVLATWKVARKIAGTPRRKPRS